jgi:hypothetical protein
MEKRAMIALALSFVVFLVFMYIGEKSKVRPLPEAQQAKQTQPAQPVARLPRPRLPNGGESRLPARRSRPGRLKTWWWNPVFGRCSPKPAAGELPVEEI